jgi:hypothetical protein
MIGTQPTGAISGVVISAVCHEGLTVTDDGQVIAVGQNVAREAEAVAINSYRSLLQGKGHLRVTSKLPPGAA